jgi:RNA polymerase sigma-70 factor (ECF subfamily)
VDDAELLAAWRAGQRDAGDALVRRHLHELVGFFRLRVPHAADDLVQRTLLACTEGRERIAGSSFRGFLFGVARRQLLKFLDEQRRSADHDGLYFQPGTRPASVITPSGVVALRQEHWLLLQALARLDDDQQIALALYYVQGLSTKEIGEACDVPPSTVTSRLHRARAALRESLDRDASPIRDAVLADLDRWMTTLAPLTHVIPGAT